MASEVNHHVGYSQANECWFVRFYPYQTEQQASEAAAAFTRPAPAATDTGLVTVGEVSTVRESVASFAGHMLNRQLKPGDLLCLHSHAEALLMAERAEKEKLEAAWLKAEGIISDLKADNAAKDAQLERLADDYQAIREQLHRGWQECRALKADNATKDARIKELETERDEALRGNRYAQLEQIATNRAKALEADNKRLLAERDALREALEMMVEMVEMNGFGRDYAMYVASAALKEASEQ